ncbi:hypothetical protein GF325_11805 [Candidatus Bathyarchaeota archaeon]|nr:hypothetical protein [Candidatus Bathyarchaeota archaeon]
MPKGIILIGWDVKKGPLLLHSFPPSLNVPESVFNKIYVAHRQYSTDAGFSRMSTGDMKVISFYSGFKGKVVGKPECVVAMIFRKDENSMKGHALLLESSEKILKNINNDKYRKLMEETFEKMKEL